MYVFQYYCHNIDSYTANPQIMKTGMVTPSFYLFIYFVDERDVIIHVEIE